MKRYISKTGVKYTFLVNVNGKTKSVSFRGSENDCIVSDKETQKAIENSRYFKNGYIGVAPGTTAGGFDEDVGGPTGEQEPKTKTYPEITDFTDARELLMNEYGLSPQQIKKNPEAVLAKAAELGVSFPNLK